MKAINDLVEWRSRFGFFTPQETINEWLEACSKQTFMPLWVEAHTQAWEEVKDMMGKTIMDAISFWTELERRRVERFRVLCVHYISLLN
jgi:hypothetical protein